MDVSNDGRVEKYAKTSETEVYSNWVFVHRYIFHLFRPDRGAGQVLTNAAGCVLLVIYVLGLIFWRRIPANHVALVTEGEVDTGNSPESSR